MKKIFNQNIENVYSADVITFARKKGFFTGKDSDFSFSDSYAPVDFGGARFCEIRVWSMFNDVTSDMDKYWEYCKGNIEHGEKLASGNTNSDKYATNRMPLWVKPTQKVSVLDMMHFMRNHLEGTELDMSKDMGAGAFGNPYRWRGLTWKVGDQTYCNERATATQQTGFSFIAQLRSWLPREIGAINWFAVDDAASCVYFPIYASITEVPHSLAVGNGDMMTWSDNSAFWTFNLVSNFAYTRYSLIHPEIEKKQSAYEQEFVKEVANIDAKAQKLLSTDKKQAVELLTKFSGKSADSVTEDWSNFFKFLFIKYSDGNIKEKVEVPEGYKYHTPKLTQPGYGEEWYKRIATETGDKLKMPEAPPHH